MLLFQRVPTQCRPSTLQLIKSEGACHGAGGDWARFEAVAVPAIGGGAGDRAYVFAGNAHLYGPVGQCELLVMTETAQPPPPGVPGERSFHVLLAPGLPARLQAELSGLPPGVTVVEGAKPPVEATGPVRFDGGEVRLRNFPRRGRIDAVSIRVVDLWNNPVRGLGCGEKAQQPRSRACAARAALVSEGASLLLGPGENPRAGTAPSRRHVVSVPPASRGGAAGLALAHAAEFLHVRVCADSGAAETRLRVSWNLPDAGAAASPAAGAAAQGLCAEVVLELASTNRVVRVVTAPAPCGISLELRAGECFSKLIATVETEDGAGFDGSRRTLHSSFEAVCSLIPAATAGAAGRLAAGGNIRWVPYLDDEERDSEGGRAGGGGGAAGGAVRRPGATTVYFGGAEAWIPGEYEARVRYTERRALLISTLSQGDLVVESDVLRFRVRGPFAAPDAQAP